jgi:4a-hydroxytetrahydrobiopterin dehydratase
MSELTEQKCTACRADAPAVTDAEKTEMLKQIPEWTVQDHNGIPTLVREYAFDDFVKALEFTNKVGAIAEEAGHHPAITTEYGKVTVAWWTHKIRNLHRNDFIMAAKTDAVFQ